MRETNFKHTEIGDLPKDWEIKPIGDLYTIRSSKRVFQSQWTTKGIPFFRAREIVSLNNKEKFSSPLFISRELYAQLKDSYGVPQINDILITGVGTLGIPYLINNNTPFYFKDGNIIWLQHQDLCDSVFVKYCYKSPILLEQIYGDGIGSTVGTYTIQRARQTLVPYPTLEEQYKIGRTLTDIDDLIFSLKKLIEKKRAIKVGEMSQLLSGKLRLPGFSEPWHTISLSQLSEFTNITIPCDIFDDSSYVCTENMKSDCGGIIAYEDIVPYVYSKSYVPFDILLSNIRPYLKKIWLADKSGCCSNDILTIRPNFELVSPHFLYYCLAQDCFFNYVMEGAAGTKMPRGNKTHISQYEFEIPSDLEEQKAIAKVLTDMDEEISASEAKLKKYEQLKKGMMQQLLTGKIRLVSPNESLS